MPPILPGALFLAGLLLLSAGLGRRLLRWLRVPSLSVPEHGVLAVGLGLGALQAVPFVLFALGLGRPLAFRLTVVALALALMPDTLKAARAPWGHLRRLRRIAGIERAAAGRVAALLALALIRAVCPITDDDGLMYHLTAAARFLQAGRFVYIPTITPTNWPLGVESLFALVLGIDARAPVGIVPYALGLVGIGATWLCARALAGRAAAAGAVLLLVIYPVYWLQMASAQIDLGTLVFATLAAYAMVCAGSRPSAAPWLRLSAVFAGLAATTKLNGAAVPIALAAIWLARPGGAPASRTRQAAAYVGVACAVAAPWFVRTWVLTGNPIYPVAYHVLGGREWTADGWSRYVQCHLLFNTPPGGPPAPARLLAAHLAIASLAVIVAAIAFVATRRSGHATYARFAALFAVSVCAGSYFNLRFLLPILPLAATLLACWAARRRWAVAALAGLVAVSLVVDVARLSSSPPLGAALQVAVGAMSADRFLSIRLPEWRVVQYANTRLPPGAAILVSTFAERTAMFAPPAHWADYWRQDSIHYESQARLAADLDRLGITHVLLEPMDVAWCARSYVCGPRLAREWRPLRQLVERAGVRLCASNGFELYQLRPPMRAARRDAARIPGGHRP